MANTTTKDGIKEVYAYYSCLNEPTNKYNVEKAKDLSEKEYKMTVCISADAFKKLKKKYPNATTLRAVKRVDASEFEKKYRVAPPEGFANGDDEYLMLNFNQYASLPPKTVDGKTVVEARKPITVVGATKSGTDREGKVVTQETLVGNGSLVHVQFLVRPVKNTNDVKLALDKVFVVNLVPYEVQDEDVFDLEDSEDDVFESEGDSVEEAVEAENDEWDD